MDRDLRSLIAALLAVAALACGDDAAPAEDAGPVGMDASATCRDDAECDDGTFCNGAEACSPGDDAADARGCVTTPRCMPSQTCDEAADRCVTGCATPDADGDGHDAIECGGDDCDDADRNRYPGNAEVCDTSGHDEDCDAETYGFRDLDSDGDPDARCCNTDDSGAERCGTDCDDMRATTNPSAPEVCNSVDDDCDGATDEEVQDEFWVDGDEDGYGDPAQPTVLACRAPAGYADQAGDCDDGAQSVHAGASEDCNGVDEDCDSSTDEGLSCGCTTPGATRACPQPGACSAGTQTCNAGSWSACSVPPQGETCNAVDDDCDGVTDDPEVAPGTCGSRDHASPVCTSGTCGFVCEDGYASCDGPATGANGCETNLDTSLSHCGACGSACAPTAHVLTRVCAGRGSGCRATTCDVGWGDCNTTWADGCERNLRTISDCGACGVSCPARANAGASCATGSCAYACSAGYYDCNGDLASPTGNGCEIRGNTTAHCNGCAACPAPPANGAAICTAGGCDFTCNAGYVRVASPPACNEIEPPWILSPLADQVVTSRRPNLRWRLGANATGVRIQICTNATCTGTGAVVQQIDRTGATPFRLTTDLAPGTYYWRAFGLSGSTPGPRASVPRRFALYARSGTTYATVAQTLLDTAGGGPDIAITSLLNDRVMLHRSGGSSLDDTTDWMHTLGTAAGFGSAVAPAGDVNADGHGDLVVGACVANGDVSMPPDEASCSNRVYVYRGNASGTFDLPPQQIDAPSGEQGFGHSVASAGDFDGDGYADIVVGAYYSNHAYVYFGSASGIDTSRSLELGGGGTGSAGGLFGTSVNTAGDFDGDGYGDVVVGAPISNYAWIYRGGAVPMAGSDYTLDPDSSNANFGLSVSCAGDVNGDGLPDVVAGGNGRWTSVDPTLTGLALVFAGTTSTTADRTWLWQFQGPMGSQAGMGVSGIGDMNGDGYAEYAIGARGNSTIYIVRGGTYARGAATVLWSYTFDQTGVQFARFLGGPGDVTGDGRWDLVASSTSFAYFFAGAATAPSTYTTRLYNGDGSITR